MLFSLSLAPPTKLPSEFCPMRPLHGANQIKAKVNTHTHRVTGRQTDRDRETYTPPKKEEGGDNGAVGWSVNNAVHYSTGRQTKMKA